MSTLTDRINNLSPEKRALLAERLAALAPGVRPRQLEPIAVVGIGCRFPGPATSPQAFWKMLCDGVDAVTVLPPDRWDAEVFYSSDVTQPGKMNTRWGGFVAGIDRFDAEFFGICPREAARMDPQQRLLLEVAWEALEQSGQLTDRLAGSQTGVFLGLHSQSSDYYQMQTAQPRLIDIYTSTGGAHSIAANRLSYLLDLQGPSLVVDTACSSSLVAIHVGCQSLRLSESDLALAGGVNLVLTPEATLAFSKLQMMALDGRCKTFDARADGYVRGEGCGVVVLKRLSDAQRERDPILAVIRGSAVNQDGASNGLTAPNSRAQEALVRRALSNAGIDPDRIGLVECHGTGTALGDPIEVEALAAVFGPPRQQQPPCRLGAVKTNLGHLESAAGVAGMIKAVLCLTHRFIPGNLHFERLNPHIALENTPFALALEGRPWESSGLLRCAGVSSFGFGGTNAHVILEEAPDPSTPLTPLPEAETAHVLPISSRSEAALLELAESYRTFFEDSISNLSLRDLAYTAGVRRRHHDFRLAVVGRSRQEWIDAIQTAIVGGRASGNSGVVFIYSGQGPQWLGMGRELYEREPAFRQAIDTCDEFLFGLAHWSLREVLTKDEHPSRLTLTEFAQPAIFALQVGLTALWRSWGIVPKVVIGHSMGEVAAAHAAGVLGLEDALRVIFHRSRLMRRAKGQGRMAAVGISADEARRLIAGREPSLSIAAINSPTATVLSGDAEVLVQVASLLEARGVFVQLLDADYAFHSAQMDPFCEELRTALAEIVVRPCAIPLISTVTGLPAAREDYGPDYWTRNIRHPVLFAAGIERLLSEGRSLFLEISPHPVLGSCIRQGMTTQRISAPDRPDPTAKRTVLASLRREQSERETMLHALGALYVAGYPVDWRKQHPAGGKCVPLPRYPWQRKRCWLEEPVAALPAKTEGDLSRWFYDVEWELRGRFLPSAVARPAANFKAPTEIAARVLSQVDAVCTGFGLPRRGDLLEQLDAASLAFTIAGLTELGLSFAAGERWNFPTSESLAAQLGILPKYARLVGRFAEICASEGLLAREATGWRVTGQPLTADPCRQLARLGNEFPKWQTVFHFLERFGLSLAKVLRGEVSPLSLLFTDDSTSSAEAIFQEVPFARAANTLIAETLEAVLANLPAARTLRMLEIGAGTGGTTASIVGRLPARQVEYVFTDVSKLFLARAREKFRHYPFMRYAILDIEQTDGALGDRELIASGAFDLILAANVLHATSDLRKTLRNVRNLLTPGGILVLLEGTAPRRWIDMTFGLTDGWWKFSDFQVRPSHPLVSPESWRPLLAEEGFPETAVVPCQIDAASALFPQVLLISRASMIPAPDSRRIEAARGLEANTKCGSCPPGAPPATSSHSSETWLIFDDRRGTGQSMASSMEFNGRRCLLVEPGERFEVLEKGRYRVRPGEAADYHRLVREAFGDGSQVCYAVVHLWSSDIADLTRTTDWETSQVLTCGSVLSLAQALIKAAVQPVKGLWLVTRGAQTVPGDPGSPAIAQAPVWGFGRSLAVEHPELWGGLIDLGPVRDERDAGRLLTEITTPDGEDQIALRHDRFVCRLAACNAAPQGTVQMHADAAYLITGGLGGLGIKIARWMANHGARHVVLLGRSGIPDRSLWANLPTASKAHRIVTALQAIEQLGVTVEVVTADVSDRAALAAVVGEFGKSRPPLRGVVHAATAWNARPLAEMSWETLDGMMRPKTMGTWNLHELTRECPLDFFALFSSTTSLLGSHKLAHYAAANAFLDAFAHYRRFLGLPVVSINWGTWDEMRPFSREEQSEPARFGLKPMPSERALAALGQLLFSGEHQKMVAAIDWAELLPAYTAKRERRLFERIESRTNDRPAPTGRRSDFMQRLEAAAPEDQLGMLEDLVRREVARVLGHGPSQPLDPRRGFFDLGMDSLTSVQLRRELEANVERSLPSTITFNYPTIATLTAFLASELLARAPGASPGPGPSRNMQERGGDLESVRCEPIAVIGLGCRLPGGVNGPQDFWQLLATGTDAITAFPAARRELYRSCGVQDAPGEPIGPQWGGFIDGVEQFDPRFFGITPREAASMDPQHRLLLEVGWEALAHAGQPPDRLAGSATGVFVGITGTEYLQLLMQSGDPAKLDAYVLTGNALNAAPGRLAYLLGLQGPSVAIDTACSSSLVAVHLACQSLRSGECRMALAGGVNVVLSPKMLVCYSRWGMLAPDGRCKTFDARANGFVRGEGCGIVVLKRLSDALSDGDRVLALLKGSAVNQDGRSSGLTAPNGLAQQAVVRAALENAGVKPSQVSYVEAHGTGTALGDPIEIEALAAVYGDGRPVERPLAIGSVKTNVGHLESASGVTGLIKVVLSLQNAEIPPHLHLTRLTPQIPWDRLAVTVPTQRTPWQAGTEPRMAGVSSFGFSGTNAHMVVAEPPGPQPARANKRVDLSTCSFQRQRCWIDVAASARHAIRSPSNDNAARHPLLGHCTRSPLIKETIFECRINLDELPYLSDHRVHGKIVIPMTVYLEMATAAAQAAFGEAFHRLEDVEISEPLLLAVGASRIAQIVLGAPDQGRVRFQIVSRSAGENGAADSWTAHVAGNVRIGFAGDAASTGISHNGFPAERPAGCAEELPAETLYQRLESRGILFGAGFRGVRRLWRGEREGFGQIRLPDELTSEADRYALHPACLDACLQVFGAIWSEPCGQGEEAAYMPIAVKAYHLHASPGRELTSHVVMRSCTANAETLTGDTRVFGADGRLVAFVEGLTVSATRRLLHRALREPFQDWLYEVAWKPVAAANREHTERGDWLIFEDRGGVGRHLVKALAAHGEKCIRVSGGNAFAAHDACHFTIDSTSPVDHERVLEHVAASVKGPLRGVVHLGSLDQPDPCQPTIDLDSMLNSGSRSALSLVRTLGALGAGAAPHLWLVTRNAQPAGTPAIPLALTQAPLWGMGKVIALEHPELHCTRVDLDPAAPANDVALLCEQLLAPDDEREIAFRGGVRHVARLIRYVPSERATAQGHGGAEEPMRLESTSPGVLDSLMLRPASRRIPGPGEVEIQVRALGLTFRDVLSAMGMYPGDAGPLGGECAGTVVAVGKGLSSFRVGDEVAGIAFGCFGTYATTAAALLIPRFDELSFEEMATLPSAFMTAWEALHEIAQIRSGERVLIHAAAGGVGLAAVQLARNAGLEIFATAGNSEKRAFLTSLGVPHVMNSRTLTFAEEIREKTGGSGVDIVLNCLNGDFIPASLSSLQPRGRFVEIGLRGIWSARQVAERKPDVCYTAIDLAEVCRKDPARISAILRSIREQFRRGALKPLPMRVFPVAEAVGAFRHMAQAKHIGKVVVTLPVAAPAPVPRANEAPLVRPEATYLITGGLSGLGLRLAQWMVEQGARHLVLMARSMAAAAQSIVDELVRAGAHIAVRQGDVSNPKDVARILEEIRSSFPMLRGVVHAAGVLDDGVLMNQNWERFTRVLAPKVQGAWLLHNLTQGDALDFFVLFSSASAVLGSAGQSNHAAANAFLDALAHHRRALGFPALSVNWGVWSRIGAAAERNVSDRLRTLGIGSFSADAGLRALEYLLRQGAAHAVVAPMEWSRFVHSPAAGTALFFSDIVRDNKVGTVPKQATAAPDLPRQLEQTRPPDRLKLLQEHVHEQVVRVLGFGACFRLDPRQGLRDLGVDSLMSIELRNRLQTSTGAALPATLVYDYPTLESLVEFLAHDVLRLAPVEPRVPHANGPAAKDDVEALSELDSLSAGEAEALLLDELAKAQRRRC